MERGVARLLLFADGESAPDARVEELLARVFGVSADLEIDDALTRLRRLDRRSTGHRAPHIPAGDCLVTRYVESMASRLLGGGRTNLLAETDDTLPLADASRQRVESFFGAAAGEG